MRRTARVAFALAAGTLFLALTRCGAFSADDAAAPSAEAGAEGGAVTEASTDSGAADALATSDSGCRPIVGDPVVGPGWTLLGGAKRIGGAVLLTPAISYATGGIAHILDAPLTSFRATIRVHVGARAKPADGLTFFWSPSNDPRLGENGAALGFCGDGGPPGTAVAIVTQPDDPDGGKDRVEVRDPAVGGCAGADAVTIAPIATDVSVTFVIDVDLATRSLRVREGSAELLLTQVVSTFAIASFGVTAATGGNSTEHIVESAVIEVCP